MLTDDDDDDDVSFYNSTASTRTLATPRTTWVSMICMVCIPMHVPIQINCAAMNTSGVKEKIVLAKFYHSAGLIDRTCRYREYENR